jgi:hypothetical protein
VTVKVSLRPLIALAVHLSLTSCLAAEPKTTQHESLLATGKEPSCRIRVDEARGTAVENRRGPFTSSVIVGVALGMIGGAIVGIPGIGSAAGIAAGALWGVVSRVSNDAQGDQTSAHPHEGGDPLLERCYEVAGRHDATSDGQQE